MISIQDLRGRNYDPEQVLPRVDVNAEGMVEAVKPIILDVQRGGEAAILDLTERLDGIRPASLRVPEKELAKALDELQPEIRRSLETAIERAKHVHAAQKRETSTTTFSTDAAVTTQWLPVERVGLYVPGGGAVYPSSVIMNVVPALVAGVSSLAITSPPQKEFGGLPHPTIMAAAALLGVTEVYAVGGAQAIAMFAFGAKNGAGDEVCRKVNVVTGPGNIWVSAAKRFLRGRIGTDSEAGPTEVMILADGTANARWVAADMISQAEHDPLAASVLVTTSLEFAKDVEVALSVQVGTTQHSDRVRQALGGVQSGIIVVDDLDECIALADAYGAEHLEVHTENASADARRIRNAGAIFVGPYSPVSLGDYSAGSNHVLPTGGGATHTGGLSVQTFLRCTYLVEYGEEGLAEVADAVVTLSRAENLPAHGDAILQRTSDGRT